MHAHQLVRSRVITSFYFYCSGDHRNLHSFPTRRSSDLETSGGARPDVVRALHRVVGQGRACHRYRGFQRQGRSEEHTSELQSLTNLVCRLLLEKKKTKKNKEALMKSQIVIYTQTDIPLS